MLKQLLKNLKMIVPTLRLKENDIYYGYNKYTISAKIAPW